MASFSVDCRYLIMIMELWLTVCLLNGGDVWNRVIKQALNGDCCNQATTPCCSDHGQQLFLVDNLHPMWCPALGALIGKYFRKQKHYWLFVGIESWRWCRWLVWTIVMGVSEMLLMRDINYRTFSDALALPNIWRKVISCIWIQEKLILCDANEPFSYIWWYEVS